MINATIGGVCPFLGAFFWSDQCYDRERVSLFKGLFLEWTGVTRSSDIPPVPLRSQGWVCYYTNLVTGIRNAIVKPRCAEHIV